MHMSNTYQMEDSLSGCNKHNVATFYRQFQKNTLEFVFDSNCSFSDTLPPQHLQKFATLMQFCEFWIRSWSILIMTCYLSDNFCNAELKIACEKFLFIK